MLTLIYFLKKSAIGVRDAFDKIFKEDKRIPKKLWTDNDKNFILIL